MDDLLKRINKSLSVFFTEAEKDKGGNKAAGVRARKATFELEKMMKEYRQISLAANKAPKEAKEKAKAEA